VSKNKQSTYEKLIIYTDGAARGNPGPAGAGGQITTPAGEVLAEISEYLGETTNNVAEYKALLLTLEKSLPYNPAAIVIISDSELLVKQLKGEYKVRNEGLKPLHERVKRLLMQLKNVSIEHVYRSENKQADQLANKAIDSFEKGETQQHESDEASEQGTLF